MAIPLSDYTYKLIRELYTTTNLSGAEIAKRAGVEKSTVNKFIARTFSPTFRIEREQTLAYPNRPYTSKETGGYLRQRKPLWFTGNPSVSYACVHHVVWCEANGVTCIPSGHVVHHIDDNVLNNDISNLQLMSRSEHSKHHSATHKCRGLK